MTFLTPMRLQNRKGEEERGDALCFLNYSPNISFSRLCFTQASVPASLRPFTHGAPQQNILQQNLKEKRKKAHQSGSGWTDSNLCAVYTYRIEVWESINLRNLSFHVRSAYVYALVWHMSHFS